jgi:hypothetical protein
MTPSKIVTLVTHLIHRCPRRPHHHVDAAAVTRDRLVMNLTTTAVHGALLARGGHQKVVREDSGVRVVRGGTTTVKKNA